MPTGPEAPETSPQKLAESASKTDVELSSNDSWMEKAQLFTGVTILSVGWTSVATVPLFMTITGGENPTFSWGIEVAYALGFAVLGGAQELLSSFEIGRAHV